MSADELYSTEMNEWNKMIAFYLEEIDIFQKRLTEVAHKNNAQQVTAAIESFENQFSVQDEELQKLRHDINKQQKLFTNEIKIEGRLRSLDLVDEEFLLRDRAQMAEKILLELKHSFYRFLSKVL